MPRVDCQACGEIATLICAFCQHPSCKKCIKKDECENIDNFLPFVNSPHTEFIRVFLGKKTNRNN